jgi:type IV secretion system protein VirD4
VRRLRPAEVGWRLGTAKEPHGGELWVPWDRTAGVVGPQGSGKTLDLLAPALIDAPGAALTTLTKVDDLLLTFTARSRDGRPCVVLDPFGLVPGLPEVVWDPIRGCVDPLVAERRAKAFTAGTVKGAVAGGHGDDAARFYAAEAAKVLQGYFHAAALTGRTLEDVLGWVAKPMAASAPAEILREHPHAAAFWDGLLYGALHGDDRTAGNTITTVQQAMSLFFQEDIRRRCVPGPGRPPTDIGDVIARGGTVYLLGREDPYASASPLMTAFAEHVLDTALAAANTSPWGRLCPPFHAILDELPSTAPLPTLRTRMANERALGISFMWAAQAWPQLSAIFGEQEARTLVGLTNNLIVFGGSKDVAFNREISDLLGQVRISRTSWQSGRMGGRQVSADDISILTPAEVRQLKERHALVLSENGAPIIARLRRCIDGKQGRQLLEDQARLRTAVATGRQPAIAPDARATAALVEARRHGLVRDYEDVS